MYNLKSGVDLLHIFLVNIKILDRFAQYYLYSYKLLVFRRFNLQSFSLVDDECSELSLDQIYFFRVSFFGG